MTKQFRSFEDAKELGKEAHKIIPQIENETYIIKPCLPEYLAYKPYAFSKEEFEILVNKSVNREELLDEIYSITNRFIPHCGADLHLAQRFEWSLE